ncbi:hypothetical protein Rs2_21533 [Raphanus sativus]|nr:hypothetical protein Rs2_21533 [Raphanus sativus]
MGDNGDGDKGEPIVEPMPRRTSKRLRLVPQPLISDYQCEIAILNRARQTKLVASKLSIILKKPCVINVVGLSVSAKDITDVAEKSRPLPAKVFDILMRLVISTCYTHVACNGGTKPELFHSRFVSMLYRNYERFKKSKMKASYVFLKGLVDCAVKSCSSENASTRFYLPLHVEKKHWLGLCVDFTDAKSQLVTACPVGMLLKGEDMGSSLTNNLIMEIVRSHNGGVGVGALQRCELGSMDRWFRRTGCYNKKSTFIVTTRPVEHLPMDPRLTALQRTDLNPSIMRSHYLHN